MAPGPRTAAAPRMSAMPASHGAMWIMLRETTAAAEAIGQGCSATSRRKGASTLVGPSAASHSAIDCTTLRVALARLPGQLRRFLCEMDDVLPGSASDLEHNAAIGQHVLQYFPDRSLVALRRRAEEAPCLKTAQCFAAHRRLIITELEVGKDSNL